MRGCITGCSSRSSAPPERAPLEEANMMSKWLLGLIGVLAAITIVPVTMILQHTDDARNKRTGELSKRLSAMSTRLQTLLVGLLWLFFTHLTT